MSSTLKERLKKIDTHSSVSNEFRVYTVSGAVLSVTTVCFILYLVWTEITFNFQTTVQQRVHVNATSPRGLEMEFDITLHSVKCSQLSIDAQDPSGQSMSLHLDKEHHVWKHRVEIADDGAKFNVIGSRNKIELGSTLLDMETVEYKIAENSELMQDENDNDCLSCYGAGDEDECCNTCEDVQRAYKRKGWALPDLSTIAQCRQSPQTDEGEHEGCNVHGKVALDSGGGNLHLAPGEDMANGLTRPASVSLFDLLLLKFHEWNVTHTIHKLRFGPEHPDAIYQLEGQKRVVKDSHGMYQYYLQIIPTQYKFQNGTTIQTNQYSVTEHLRHVPPGSNRGLPGVFFFYEVSPLHVEITEGYRKGWIAFVTSVCAVVGGVVTTMGLLDQYLFGRKDSRTRQQLAL
ncbi:hypothetical protein FisN_29Hh026 [Fistulifera solaris]|uniref:Endoplasmic reticulum-Golgi intermediate compartment protein 3 n=1 Tax=Fistulifera solaris TaxID=1519565 RepID=A0A1Z5K5N2_FISSO|nr:hypothetical protein FisN_29Hh026 [Fistulifera solaris]|eukprot:GAX21593.1 hypothetical protein FisN_29Hh026 [Fistulifera solaris]